MTNPNNPFAIARKFELFALSLVDHQLTGEVNTITPLRKLKTGGFVNVLATSAEALLTFTANPNGSETATIGGLVYTYRHTAPELDAPREVLIGATAEDSLINLLGAINGVSANEGITHAPDTAAHPSVYAKMGAGDTLRVIAHAPGAAGNAIALDENLDDGTWSGATLAGGSDGRALTLADGWHFGPPRPRPGIVILSNERANEREFRLAHNCLTPAQALLVAAILRGSFRYAVDFNQEPEGIEQEWTYKVTGREDVS